MNEQAFREVIELIFAKLAVRYGADWLRQWDGVDMALVKDDWAEELSGFANGLEPLRYALRNLPVKCPNVAQFRALANACPPADVPRLEAPRASERVVAEEIAKQTGLKRAIAHNENRSKDWARAIVSRAAAGERITPYSLRSARQALGMEGRQKWQ